MVSASTAVVSSSTWNEAARSTAGSLVAWEEGLADAGIPRRQPPVCVQAALATALASAVASGADVEVSEVATEEASGAETGASGVVASVVAIADSVALLMGTAALPTRPVDLVMAGVGSVVVLTVVTAETGTTEAVEVGMPDAATTEVPLDPTQSPSENVLLDTGAGIAIDTTTAETTAAETTAAETTAEMTTANVRTRAGQATRESESFVGTSISVDGTNVGSVVGISSPLISLFSSSHLFPLRQQG